jgi:hypothetical protein
MAAILRSIPGSVSVENVDGPQYFSVSGIPNAPGMILTSVRVSRKESMAFLRTLGGNVYAYAFGEMPGSISVAGTIFFLNSCGGAWGNFAPLNMSYGGKRAYKGGMTFIGIGGASFRCAMTGVNFGAEAGPFPDGKFSFDFTIIPSEGK